MKNGKPEQGDIIKINFAPSLGHEQQGYRPSIVISNPLVSQFSNIWICCPISHTQRNYPYYVKLPNECDTDGKILIDQIKAFDLTTRDFEYTETVNDEFKVKISTIAKTLFDI